MSELIGCLPAATLTVSVGTVPATGRFWANAPAARSAMKAIGAIVRIRNVLGLRRDATLSSLADTRPTSMLISFIRFSCDLVGDADPGEKWNRTANERHGSHSKLFPDDGILLPSTYVCQASIRPSSSH